LGLILLAAMASALVWWSRRGATGDSLLQAVYNESQPISSRVSDLKKLSETGQKNFDGIKLPGANLSGLALDHASFRSAVLKSASFRKSNLKSCDFSGADLTGADLTQANFSDCVLRNTDLTQADFSKTDLRGADLTGATVSPDQIAGSITDSRTVGLPAPTTQTDQPQNSPEEPVNTKAPRGRSMSPSKKR
jgi:uncharacterized protein YjbI with pentapeptide repeats